MVENMFINTAVVSVAGAVLSLDRTAAFQTMVSRPLVAAPVIGFLLGAVVPGFIAGVMLELLFIGELAVGRHIPVHETGIAVLVTAMTVAVETALVGAHSVNRLFTGPVGAMMVVPVAILLSLPVSVIYRKTDELTRKFNSRFFAHAAFRLESGEDVCMMKENMKGLLLFFIMNVVTFFITILPMTFIVRFVFSYVGASWLLYPAFAVLSVLGLASALSAVSTKRSFYIFTAAGALTAVIWMVVV